MSLNRPVKIDNFIYPQAEDAGDHHVLQQIEEHGWSLIAIPGDPVEGPPFAFSIGFYLHTLEPEILIMGMDAKSSHYVIEKIHDYIQAGNTLKVDQPYADILDGGSLLFRQIAFKHYREYLGTAIWFYRKLPQAFPALQCFWSDKNGCFPRDPECRKQVAELQQDLTEE